MTDGSTLCDGMRLPPGRAWPGQPIPAAITSAGSIGPWRSAVHGVRGGVDDRGRGRLEPAPVDDEIGRPDERRGRLGRGRRGGLAVPVGAGRRDRSDAARRRPARGRGPAPAARSCAAGSPRCRSSPARRGSTSVSGPGQKRSATRSTPGTGSASASACSADAHSTASGTSARRPFSANTRSTAVARRRQRGQPVHGVGRQHDHARHARSTATISSTRAVKSSRSHERRPYDSAARRGRGRGR